MSIDIESSSAPEWFCQAVQCRADSYFFNHDNIRLHYLSWPFAQNVGDSNKPALIFLHGFRGHARWWGFIAPSFLQKYRVYALDLSGMGDSDCAETYDTNTHCDEILAFIEHLALSEVTVVAHSFGGARTFRAATKNPSVFKKIIAIDSYVGFGGGFAGSDPARQTGRKVYASLADGVARFRLIPSQPDVVDYVFEYIARHSLKELGDGWTWKFDPHLLVDNILRNDGDIILPRVQCQVDYIYGSESGVITAERAAQIQTHLAKPGRFIKIPNGHHHLMISHPIELIASLQALL